MKLPVSFGNRKLASTCMIYNMTSAAACPADKLGMCPHSSVCYAKKAERLYPRVLPYRQRQEDWWRSQQDPIAFVRALRKTTKYFRFSEAGDFRIQHDVTRMAVVCSMLVANGITCYGYTARYDLDFSTLILFASVIVTGHDVPGCSRSDVIPKHATAEKGVWLCPGKDCLSTCKVCTMRNKKIAFNQH